MILSARRNPAIFYSILLYLKRLPNEILMVGMQVNGFCSADIFTYEQLPGLVDDGRSGLSVQGHLHVSHQFNAVPLHFQSSFLTRAKGKLIYTVDQQNILALSKICPFKNKLDLPSFLTYVRLKSKHIGFLFLCPFKIETDWLSFRMHV